MDNALNKTSIYSTKTAVDDFFEEKTELDIVIPDYCPAAAKILSCSVTPTLLSHSADGDRVSVDIRCKANVVYTDDDGCIRSVSKTETFGKSIAKTAELNVYRIKSGIRPISVNCRMQNPRRITVRAVIGTALKVLGNCEVSVAAENEGIEAVYQNISANLFSGFGDTTSHISGDISVSGDITDIIETGGTVSITDVKAVESKAIVKGSADIFVVYTIGDSTEDFCFAESSIPFSDVVDVDGITELSDCQVNARLADIRCEIAGDSGQIAVEADSVITVSAYTPCDMELMCDAYSMSQSVSVSKTDVNVESFCDHSKFTETVSGSFQSDFDKARIIGICADPVIKSIFPRDGMLSIDGDMMVTVYMCNDDEYKISERTIPFSVSRPMVETSGNIRCEADAVVKTLSFTMPDDENVNVTASVDFELCCFCSNAYSVISEIRVAEEKINKCKGVTLYYAEQGERIWDIAKKYRSSVNVIRRDNNIDGDVVENDKMLLIAYN